MHTTNSPNPPSYLHRKRTALHRDMQEPTVNLAQTSPVLCNSIRDTHTHTPLRPEPTSPFNSVGIVLCPSFSYAEPGSTGSREIDETLVPNALQEHTDTGTKMHLIALRGAEITLARKSKEQVRWTHRALGGRQGSKELPAKRILACVGWSQLMRAPRQPTSLPSLPPFLGGREEAPRKKCNPSWLEWKEKEEATKIRSKSLAALLH